MSEFEREGMLKEKHPTKEKQLGKSLAYNNWYENIKRQAIKSLTCLLMWTVTAYDSIELSPVPTCACACDPSSVNTREYENVEETNEE